MNKVIRGLTALILATCLAGSAAAFDSQSFSKNAGYFGVKKTSSTQRLLNAGYGPTLTFAKDYSQGRSIDADFAVGSKTGTFTASRGSTTPATYVDQDGKIQVTTTSNIPRFTAGFYDSTGFVSRPGLIVEGAGTNLLKDSYFADGTTTYWRAAVAGGVISNSTDTQNIYFGGTTVLKVVTDADQKGFRTAATNKPTSTAVTHTYSVVLSGSGNVKIHIFADAGSSYSSSEIALSTTPKLYSISGLMAATTSNLEVQQSGAGSAIIYAHCIQFEASPFATTFIPTTTAALTRNVERLSYVSASNRTASTESIFIKFTPFYIGASESASHILLDDEGGRRILYYLSTSHKMQYASNLATAASEVATTSTLSQFSSYVFGAVSAGETASPNGLIYVNGSVENTDDDNYATNTFGTNFTVGCRFSDVGVLGQAFGIISSIAIFSDAKDATAVSQITNLINGNI